MVGATVRLASKRTARPQPQDVRFGPEGRAGQPTPTAISAGALFTTIPKDNSDRVQTNASLAETVTIPQRRGEIRRLPLSKRDVCLRP
jgi:hypothetical protein